MRTAMVIDELDHHFDRRSNSAIAKYALALRNMSFARRGSWEQEAYFPNIR
jgi:hypothetical protein